MHCMKGFISLSKKYLLIILYERNNEAQGTFRLSEKYEKDKKRKAFLF